MIELDYADREYTMGVLLPKTSNIENIQLEYLNNWINNLVETKVELSLPKFTHRTKIQLASILKHLGLKSLFNSNNADLSRMVDDAYVTNIIHEAVVIVDEDGTEATAATTAVVAKCLCRAQTQKIIFNANHTFMYYIRHKKTNTILFLGTYS